MADEPPTTLEFGGVDDLHREIYEERMSDSARAAVDQFVEGELADQTRQLLEKAIYQRYQHEKAER